MQLACKAAMLEQQQHISDQVGPLDSRLSCVAGTQAVLPPMPVACTGYGLLALATSAFCNVQMGRLACTSCVLTGCLASQWTETTDMMATSEDYEADSF